MSWLCHLRPTVAPSASPEATSDTCLIGDELSVLAYWPPSHLGAAALPEVALLRDWRTALKDIEEGGE